MAAYKFEIKSVDGTSVLDVDDLNNFAKCWLDGSFIPLSVDGDYVTPDGISVITPFDDNTSRAVKEMASFEAAKSVGICGGVLVSKATSLSQDEILLSFVKNKLSGTYSAYQQSEQGRTFAVLLQDPVVEKFLPNRKALEDVGLCHGALYLEGAAVVIDRISNVALITDMRNDAESLNDLLQRNVVKGQVINAVIGSNCGFDDDGVHDEVVVAGCDDLTTTFFEKTHSLVLDGGMEISVKKEGYCNSELSPLTHEEMFDIASEQQGTYLESESTKHRVKAVPVSKKMLNSAGSRNNELWAVGSDSSVTCHQELGVVYLHHDEQGHRIVSTASELDLSDYKKCTKTPEELSVDDPLGMGI